MSTIYLDPEQMDATASAVAEHARKVELTVADLEAACSAQVPAALASWLAQELHDMAVTARAVTVLYLVAAADTMTRAGQIRADQSLAAAVPTIGAAAPWAAPQLVGGLVVGQAELMGNPLGGWGGGGGFVLGAVEPAPYVPSAGIQQGFLLGAPGPNTPLGGYTPSSGGGGGSGSNFVGLWTLSTPGRTYLGNGIYEGAGGVTGAFHTVLPRAGHDE